MEPGAWGTFPQWGSFIVALVTLILLVINILTRKKLGEVIEMTEELKNQTAALIEQNDIFRSALEIEQARFGIETQKNTLLLRPVFRKSQETSGVNSVTILLRNYGSEATEISLEENAPEGATWNASIQNGIRDRKNGEHCPIIIQSSNGEWEGIIFYLIYHGTDGVKYKQRISKAYESNFKIEGVPGL